MNITQNTNKIKRSSLREGMLKLAAGLFILLLLNSCKFETLSNGNFDGYWHLVSIDNLSDNTSISLEDQRIFWGVTGKLIQARDINIDARGYFFQFSLSDTELLLTEVYKNNGHEDRGENAGDQPVEDLSALSSIGIFTTQMPVSYTVEKLTGGKMILSTPTHRLHFKKQ